MPLILFLSFVALEIKIGGEGEGGSTVLFWFFFPFVLTASSSDMTICSGKRATKDLDQHGKGILHLFQTC